MKTIPMLLLAALLAGCQTTHLKPSQAIAQNQLRKGMTTDEVEALLGRPSRRSNGKHAAFPMSTAGESSMEFWTYRERLEELGIVFNHGRTTYFEVRERQIYW